jgi:soluble lytic murein transglycosylase-like protein
MFTEAIVLAAALAPHSNHEQAPEPCQTQRCEHRIAHRAFERVDYTLRHRCNHSVAACITRAAHLHRVSDALLFRRARCESGLNPYARNASGASGLFQFLPSTWATTPYGRRGSIWSPKWSSLAAAWMVRVGRGGEWVCR